MRNHTALAAERPATATANSGTSHTGPPQETAIHPTIGCHLAQSHLAFLRHQTQRTALARAARRARRARPRQPSHRGPTLPALAGGDGLSGGNSPEVFVMLIIDELEIAGPGTGAHPPGGRSSFRKILVPVRSPGQAGPALAAAARICGMTGGVLRLVHVRTCDPPLRSAARFYRETIDRAAAVLEEALLTAWACGGPRATTAVVDARAGNVALAIAWQAAAWPADLIVLTRSPQPALTRLVRGSIPDQVMPTASCPVLAIPLRQHDN